MTTVEQSTAETKYFLIRLLAPRPTFLQDMTEAERGIMGEHAAYWTRLLSEGVAVGFGPVLDPKGPWGVGILELDDPSTLSTLEANDPAMRIGMRYEVLPMLRAVVRPR